MRPRPSRQRFWPEGQPEGALREDRRRGGHAMTERSSISRRGVLGITLSAVAISVVELKRASAAPVELALPETTPAER